MAPILLHNVNFQKEDILGDLVYEASEIMEKSNEMILLSTSS